MQGRLPLFRRPVAEFSPFLSCSTSFCCSAFGRSGCVAEFDADCSRMLNKRWPIQYNKMYLNMILAII